MSTALRLGERLDNYDALHPNVEIFLAVLYAPIYGRSVSFRREKRHGRIVMSSRQNVTDKR